MKKRLKIGMPVRMTVPSNSVYADFLMAYRESFTARGKIIQKSGELFFVRWKDSKVMNDLGYNNMGHNIKGWWPESYLEIDTIEYLKQLNKGKL